MELTRHIKRAGMILALLIRPIKKLMGGVH